MRWFAVLERALRKCVRALTPRWLNRDGLGSHTSPTAIQLSLFQNKDQPLDPFRVFKPTPRAANTSSAEQAPASSERSSPYNYLESDWESTDYNPASLPKSKRQVTPARAAHEYPDRSVLLDPLNRPKSYLMSDLSAWAHHGTDRKATERIIVQSLAEKYLDCNEPVVHHNGAMAAINLHNQDMFPPPNPIPVPIAGRPTNEQRLFDECDTMSVRMHAARIMAQRRGALLSSNTPQHNLAHARGPLVWRRKVPPAGTEYETDSEDEEEEEEHTA